MAPDQSIEICRKIYTWSNRSKIPSNKTYMQMLYYGTIEIFQENVTLNI